MTGHSTSSWSRSSKSGIWGEGKSSHAFFKTLTRPFDPSLSLHCGIVCNQPSQAYGPRAAHVRESVRRHLSSTKPLSVTGGVHNCIFSRPINTACGVAGCQRIALANRARARGSDGIQAPGSPMSGHSNVERAAPADDSAAEEGEWRPFQR